PVTVSGFIAGLDTPSLALDTAAIEVTGQWTEASGVQLSSIGGQKEGVVRDPARHVAALAAMAMLRATGQTSRGIELRIRYNIPVGRCADVAAIAAVVVLVNELLRRPLERRELLPVAIETYTSIHGKVGTGWVIAALLGGMTLVRDMDTLDYQRIYLPPGLYMAMVYPVYGKELDIENAPETSETQAVNLAGFVMGMYNSDLDLVSRSMAGNHAILNERMGQSGILGFGTHDGAVWALCNERTLSEETAQALQALVGPGKEHTLSVACGISTEGVIVK